MDTGQWTRQQLHSAENSVSLCDDSDGDVVGEKSVDDEKRRTCLSSWFGCTRGAPTQPLSPLSSSLQRVFFRKTFSLVIVSKSIVAKRKQPSPLGLRELLQWTAYISLL